MSRIDEALRRLADARQVGTGPHGRLDPVVNRSVLEHYPEEDGAAPAIPEPAAVPAHVPPPEASVRGVRTACVAPREPFTWASSPLERKLVVSRHASEATVLQYRRLANAIHDLQLARGLKTVTVTSALPADGKTLTVVNLGLTLSEFLAHRVLLIDADLQQPSLNTIFNLPHHAGLSEYLRSERDDIPLNRITGNLTVLPAGKTDNDAVVALTSDRMEDLVEQLAAEFDWVLVDTPCVELMTDPQLLSGITGGVLFVVRAGATPCARVHRAIACLDADCVIGTVLNGVTDDNIGSTSAA